MNLTMNHEVAGLIPGSLGGLMIQCCHELWCRSQTWFGSGIAVAPIRSLAWEPPDAASAALKSKKKKKKRKKKSYLILWDWQN